MNGVERCTTCGDVSWLILVLLAPPQAFGKNGEAGAAVLLPLFLSVSSYRSLSVGVHARLRRGGVVNARLRRGGVLNCT